MCRDKMSAWSIVLEMNCGVQTTLSHLLEEAMPQKKRKGTSIFSICSLAIAVIYPEGI